MIDHYFGGYAGSHLSTAQVEELEEAWGMLGNGRITLTPAQLEQLCAENDKPEQLFAALRRLGKTVLARAPSLGRRATSKTR